MRKIDIRPLEKRGRAETGRERYNKCGQFLGFVAALLRNSRKTEHGAGQFLDRFAVRAAPFALPAGRGSVFVSAYMLSDAL